MEIKTPLEIAQEIGAPTDNPPSTQDWYPPMHPGVVISQIHYGLAGGPIIAFRIRDTINGTVISKLASENAPGDVDGQYAEILGLEQHKNLEVLPAIYAACPDLNPESDAVTLTQGGKELLGDLIAGKLENIRPKPLPPTFSVEKGQLVVSLEKLPLDLQSLAADAVAALPGQKSVLKV